MLEVNFSDFHKEMFITARAEFYGISRYEGRHFLEYDMIQKCK